MTECLHTIIITDGMVKEWICLMGDQGNARNTDISGTGGWGHV